MLLQERIEELESGILTINSPEVELIGFTCPERLEDYYNDNIQCYFSKGIYGYEELDFLRIQDNALFLVNDKDKGVSYKYHFELILKDTIKYKDYVDGKKKQLSRVYLIRKCKYTNKYNYKDMDKSLLFDTKEDLLKYYKDRFKIDLLKYYRCNNSYSLYLIVITN